MRIRIYSIAETLFEGEAEKIIAETAMGEVTILDEHEPFISLIQGGARILRSEKRGDIISEKEIIVPIEQGFMEVRPVEVRNGSKESEVIILVADKEGMQPMKEVELSYRVV